MLIRISVKCLANSEIVFRASSCTKDHIRGCIFRAARRRRSKTAATRGRSS